MTRYRPPQPKSSAYITPRGFEQLSEELRYLWKEKRPEVTQQVSEAAALGDRSENADYIYGKRQLAEIDRRIRYLSKRIDEIQIVDWAPPDTTKVFFGALVRLRRNDSEDVRYCIVGPDEFDREDHFISCDSPLARALIGKRLGDEIELDLHGEVNHYEVAEIQYRRESAAPT